MATPPSQETPLSKKRKIINQPQQHLQQVEPYNELKAQFAAEKAKRIEKHMEITSK